AKAMLDEGWHLLAPDVAGVGEAVQQDDRRARTFIPNVELEPVGLDQPGQAGTHLRINPDGAGEFGPARGPAQAGRAGRVDVGDDARLSPRAEGHLARLRRHRTYLGARLLSGSEQGSRC